MNTDDANLHPQRSWILTFVRMTVCAVNAPRRHEGVYRALHPG
jgi:hypothetical protein